MLNSTTNRFNNQSHKDMTKISLLDSLPPLDEWLPVAAGYGQRDDKARDKIFVTLRKSPSEKTPMLRFIIGYNVLEKLNVKVGEKLAILTHPQDTHFFMLVKATSGRVIGLNGNKSHAAIVQLKLNHPTLKMILKTEVQFSIHPNNAITFRLDNTLR